MSALSTFIQWNGTVPIQAAETLADPGGLVVCPTKVGYILMATDGPGLERKFNAKQRNRNKPGVVLCSSIEQLSEMAELNDEIRGFYQMHWDDDILLGCILPWRAEALSLITDPLARALAMDRRGTSCFVIRFGRPAEQLAEMMWQSRIVTFASSANPSGVGNKGRLEGIGQRIAAEADLIIAADDYVASMQPGKTAESRYAQGVMVSMVDESGKLVPEQRGRRSVLPCPTLIRRGLDCDRIMDNLAATFLSWDYRQGTYH